MDRQNDGILSSVGGWRSAVAIAALTLLALAAVLLRWQQHGFGRGTVTIDGRVTVRVQVAASDITRERGLAGRTSLGQDEGVLFLFSEPRQYPFWMGGMKLPIEAVWFRDGTVVDLTYGLEPPGEGETPQVFRPIEPAGAVLEVPAGFIGRNDIRIGQTASAEIDRQGGLR
ncbi:MAG: DUF192 domain-containing protein [bacterium]